MKLSWELAPRTFVGMEGKRGTADDRQDFSFTVVRLAHANPEETQATKDLFRKSVNIQLDSLLSFRMAH